MKAVYLSLLMLFSFFAVTKSASQIYNQNVEAKIVVHEGEEWIELTATAYNKTTFTQSIRYDFSVIRNDIGASNFSKNTQNGRKVVEPGQRTDLSKTTINAKPEDRVVVLLLIYDDNDQIIAKDRVAYNDEETSDTEVKEEFVDKLQADDKQGDIGDSYDGIQLRGVVLDETKTKAGRDFYQLFYSSYLANQINSERIISLRESFSMGNNTRIQVLVDENIIFEFFVRTQYDYLKSMAEVSIRRVGMHFNRLNREANLIKRF